MKVDGSKLSGELSNTRGHVTFDVSIVKGDHLVDDAKLPLGSAHIDVLRIVEIVFLTTVVEDHIQAGYTHSQGWICPENIYVGKLDSNVARVIDERALDKAHFGVIGLEPYPPFYFESQILREKV